MARRIFIILIIFVLTLFFSLASGIAAEDAPPPDPPDPAAVMAGAPPYARIDKSTEETAKLSDWSRLAYQQWDNGNWNIYIEDKNGKHLLGHSNANEEFPSLNRGGTRLAFTSDRDGNQDLYTISSGAQGLTKIVDKFLVTAFPAWSPDGKKIAFQAWVDNNYELYVVNADGSNLQRLTNNSKFDGQPDWSPDGEKIVFVSQVSNDFKLFTMNNDGSGIAQLNSFSFSFHPTWSPDKKYIAFDADVDNDGIQELAVIHQNGGDEKVLHDAGLNEMIWAGSWSPDARYVAFTQVSFAVQNGQVIWTEGQLKKWDRQGTGISKLTNGDRLWYMDWETLDIKPPTSFVENLGEYTPAKDFQVKWDGKDDGSAGLRYFNVFYHSNYFDRWRTLQAKTSDRSSAFPAMPGTIVSFLTTAVDNAYNQEQWDIYNAVTTTFYNTKIEGKVFDNRGIPLERTRGILNQGQMMPMVSEVDGHFMTYTGNHAEFRLSLLSPGYQQLPKIVIPGDEDFEQNSYLLPHDSVVNNGIFKTSAGWEKEGNLQIIYNRASAASGWRGMQLGSQTIAAENVDGGSFAILKQEIVIPSSMNNPALSFMIKAVNDQPGDNSKLNIWVEPEGGTPTLLYTPPLSESWQNQSVSIWSPQWLDKNATLIFELDQDAADPPLIVHLDDIAVGASHPEFWVELTSSSLNAVPGDLLAFQIDYGNRGYLNAHNAVVTLEMDPSLKILESNPPGVVNGDLMEWSVGTLAKQGSQGQITLKIQPINSQPELVKVTAQISSSNPDRHWLNNWSILNIERKALSYSPVVTGAGP